MPNGTRREHCSPFVIQATVEASFLYGAANGRQTVWSKVVKDDAISRPMRAGPCSPTDVFMPRPGMEPCRETALLAEAEPPKRVQQSVLTGGGRGTRSLRWTPCHRSALGRGVWTGTYWLWRWRQGCGWRGTMRLLLGGAAWVRVAGGGRAELQVRSLEMRRCVFSRT